MDKPLVNRVAESGIITLNLEHYFPTEDLVAFDLKDFLFQGLILKEKDYRQALKSHEWSAYEGKVVCIFCSTDAIIPVWAFMLAASHASLSARDTYIGTKAAYIDQHYRVFIQGMDSDPYQDARVVIKGCSDKPVPASAYAYLTKKLKPVAKSIMYGEPCSTVPIYKRPLKRVR